MRQGNGTELLGMNDPRSATIGVIYVSSSDDRKSVLAAILTQEKLGRKDVVIVLPDSNKAFQSSQDFDDLKSVERKLQSKIIFVASDAPADYARQRQFSVFPTLDSYTQSLDENSADDKNAPAEKKRGFFGGRKSKPLNGGAIAAGGAAVGAAAAFANGERREPQANADNSRSARGQGSSAGTIDDDDALDDTPSVPVRRNAGAGAAAAGAAAGLYAGETLRRGQNNSTNAGNAPDLDAAGPTSNAPDTPAAVGPAGSPPATPITNASEDENGPNIIELRPVRGRNTVNLQERANAAAPSQAAEVPPTPPTRGAARRRNGGAATAAAGGLLLGAAGGAAAASAVPAGAPTSASGGASTAAATTGTARPAGGGPPPVRSTPPGRRGGGTPPRRGRVLWLLLLLLLLTAIISGIVYASINPTSFQSTIVQPISHIVPGNLQSSPATITIVPDSKEVQDSYVMQAVANQPNADQLQVAMRSFSEAPPAQSKSVPATGHTQTQPAVAKGRLTFINTSVAGYTVASGTVISASNGVSVVTNQLAMIPAGVLQGTTVSAGSITVSAHATTAGTAGNLDQGMINKICCSAGNSILVKNDTAFAGGMDPQDYTFVQVGDVNAAAAPLKDSLSRQANALFTQQLKPNERFVGDPTCTSEVQYDPATVGDKGHNVASTTITVTAKCTGVAYDQGGAQAIAKDRLQKKANIDPGSGYVLVGNIATNVSISKVNADSLALLVNAKGIWAYQFDTAKQQALARQLAGKKVSEAQTLLNSQRGINNAKIEVKGDTLPTDPAQISFVVQKVPGENLNNKNGSTGDNSASPTSTTTTVTGNGLVPSTDVKG